MTDDDILRPVKEFRSGAIHASIWRYAAADGAAEHYAVRVARRYRSEEGGTHESPYFADDDLPRLAAVSAAAYAWIAGRHGTAPPMPHEQAVRRDTPARDPASTA